MYSVLTRCGICVIRQHGTVDKVKEPSVWAELPSLCSLLTADVNTVQCLSLTVTNSVMLSTLHHVILCHNETLCNVYITHCHTVYDM